MGPIDFSNRRLEAPVLRASKGVVATAFERSHERYRGHLADAGTAPWRNPVIAAWNPND